MSKLSVTSFQSLRSSTRGFTLIELLIVMSIISILAAVGLGFYSTAQVKARDAERKNDLVQIGKAIELYYNDHNGYPVGDSAGKLIGCGATPSSCNWGDAFIDGKNTVYMGILPNDPTSTQKYFYVSDGKSYQIYARLENLNDRDVKVSAGKPQVYGTLDCGGDNCNYRIISPNSVSSVGPALTDD